MRRPSPITAVCDACVLYPAPLRDLLIWLGLSGLFRPRWSAQIHDEWKRNLLRNRPDLRSSQLDRTAALMDSALPDALVQGHQVHIAGLQLPDPGDRHVLAAAISCRASVIVTFNQKDFPAASLQAVGMLAQHPDEFITRLCRFDPDLVVKAARRQRENLRHPPVVVDHYLDVLNRQGLVQTAHFLRRHAAEL